MLPALPQHFPKDTFLVISRTSPYLLVLHLWVSFVRGGVRLLRSRIVELWPDNCLEAVAQESEQFVSRTESKLLVGINLFYPPFE
jgi:hypothetical protein